MASADALEAQENVQKAMGDMINDIDKSHLRKIQQRMHECAAKCCSNEKASLESTHGCIELCSRNVHVAQSYVHQEVGAFQERLQRCVLDCQDRTKDKVGANPSDTEMEGLKREFEKCAITCVQGHLTMIPSLMKRMKAGLDSQKLT